ncbi:site-2 protease family protein [Botrimarina colliarenosi]|nr:site-2 protease family protein [Botrimarina colliarenosi]
MSEATPPPSRPVDDQLAAPPPAEFSVEVGPELRASDLRTKPPRRSRRRRVGLPVGLFLATCASTLWVGAADWRPLERMDDWGEMAQTLASGWQQGLVYMLAVLAILLSHEMGHFVLTLIHRIPASYPLCIPVPFNPIGTMGAVIGMDGLRANRREIFDIGLAGPLAGLVVAIPILWYGVGQLDLSQRPQPGEVQLNSPQIVKWMIERQHAARPVHDAAGNASVNAGEWIGISQVNPFFMAGWVGMLITGLNMLPISQLDGGHTIYGLFGRDAHTFARGFIVVAIAYVVINLEQAAVWTPMLVLVILMGVDHPPTSDDSVELGNGRWLLGMASLVIPVLCFPLLGLRQ